jgi:hypothetical protein
MLDSYAYESTTIRHIYIVQEIVHEGKIHFNIVHAVEGMNIPISVYVFLPKDVKSINKTNKTNTVWFNINTSYQGILGFDRDYNGNMIGQGRTSSNFHFILDKGIPSSELRKLEKAWKRLLELNGYPLSDPFE